MLEALTEEKSMADSDESATRTLNAPARGISRGGSVRRRSPTPGQRSRTRCFQVMEAEDVRLLNAWTKCWADLIDFEIVPVMTSREYWASKAGE